MPGKPLRRPEDWGYPDFLTADQERALEELRARVVKERLFPTRETLMPDKHLLRFLRARDFDVKKSFNMLANYLDWAREFEDVTFHTSDFPAIARFFANGALYRAGYDKEGRPVIITHLAKVFPREVSDIQEIARAWVAFCDYLNLECEKAGSTDYTAIADLSGFSPSRNFSLALTKVLVDILQNYYPERLAYALVLNAPYAFRMIWNMIAPFLEERTKAKVHILGSDMSLLQNYVSPDVLEVGFGGKHAPYPLPDHIAQAFASPEGHTVHTGYFDKTALAAQEDVPAPSAAIKKSMSSSRLTRVRNLLARLDMSSHAKGAPTAIDVPKAHPRVTVFGATGRTGILVVSNALKAGYDVCAFVRIDGKGVPPALLAMGKEFGEEKLQIVVGDVNNPQDLDRAIETSDAVVSVMGAPPAMQAGANEFYMTTGSKIVEALERNGTKRLVVVTAAQAKRMSQAWWDKNASLTENLTRPVYWAGTYKHMADLEKFIESKKTTVDFTIVRPALLDDTATNDNYKLEADSFFVGGGPLPRPALAAFVIKECVVSNKFVGKGVALAAVD